MLLFDIGKVCVMIFYIQGLVGHVWSGSVCPCIYLLSYVVACSLLSLVFFSIFWCILPRYFWYRFLVLVPTGLKWSYLVGGEIEIHCASLQGIQNLDQLHKGLQQMEIFCWRRLLLQVLVFWKLRRLSCQPPEAKDQACGPCFKGVRDIGELFEGLQQMGRVRQGRFGRSRFSWRSHGLCPLPAVASTVIKVGVGHQLRFLGFQVAASGCRRGFSYPTAHRYLREGGSSASCYPTGL